MKSAEVIIEINGRDFLVRQGDLIHIGEAKVTSTRQTSITIEQVRDNEVIRESTQ